MTALHLPFWYPSTRQQLSISGLLFAIGRFAVGCHRRILDSCLVLAVVVRRCWILLLLSLWNLLAVNSVDIDQVYYLCWWEMMLDQIVGNTPKSSGTRNTACLPVEYAVPRFLSHAE